MNERDAPSPPLDDPEARLYSTVPLEDENGNEYVIQQQNVGRENMEGEGEWPDPDTPPRAPAPGSAAVDDPAQPEAPASPTRHPDAPDPRTTSAISEPNDDETHEGTASPRVVP